MDDWKQDGDQDRDGRDDDQQLHQRKTGLGFAALLPAVVVYW
jgi:hypothetical protein